MLLFRRRKITVEPITVEPIHTDFDFICRWADHNLLNSFRFSGNANSSPHGSSLSDFISYFSSGALQERGQYLNDLKNDKSFIDTPNNVAELFKDK